MDWGAQWTTSCWVWHGPEKTCHQELTFQSPKQLSFIEMLRISGMEIARNGTEAALKVTKATALCKDSKVKSVVWFLTSQLGQQPFRCLFSNVKAQSERALVNNRFAPISTALPWGWMLGEGAVAVLLSSLWCQRHVKTTPSSCDRGGCRSSAIPNSNWWPPAVPAVAMTLFCFMLGLQEAVYSPGHIGFGAGCVNGLSFRFKAWWWITGFG